MESTEHINTDNILSELRNKQPHILIIEDERLVCWSLEQALMKAGFSVTSLIDGSEAVTNLKSYQYDIIITDFDLPGANGDEIASLVKSTSRDTPVILTGAFSEHDLKLAGKRDLFDMFFEKPYRLNEIIEQVFCLLSMKSLKNV